MKSFYSLQLNLIIIFIFFHKNDLQIYRSSPKDGNPPVINRQEMGIKESFEQQTMNMAMSAASYIEENLRFPSGKYVGCLISSTTIGGIAIAALCTKK